MKATITETQKDIANLITNTDQELAIVNTRPQQLNPVEYQGRKIRGITDEDEASMRRSMEEERTMLQVVFELLKGLELKMREEAKRLADEERKQETTVTFGNNNSGFQLGVNSGTISGFTFRGRGV
jgi:hypothetical protein